MKIKPFPLLLLFNVSSRGTLSVDMESIKKAVDDKDSPYYYPDLIDRLNKFDISLTDKDFKHLYYGNFFFPMYNPYGFFNTIKNKMNAGRYESAYEEGIELLKQNPVNLKALSETAICALSLGNADVAVKYMFAVTSLIKAILNSGDGKSPYTAFVVISIADEYELLSAMGLRSAHQALSGQTDVISIENPKNGQNKVYFNVSLPLSFNRKFFAGSIDESNI